MLNRIFSEEIKLIARDSLDCAPCDKKSALKVLSRDEEDSFRIAGLAKTITIKVGADTA